MLRRCVIFIIVFIMFSSNCLAATAMRSITIYEGLAGESVFDIFKSRQGFMYFATTNGLSCYKGNQLINYRVGFKRSRNIVKNIAQASDGSIWAGTSDGLYKMDTTRERLVNVLPEVRGEIRALKIVGGVAYAGTAEGLWFGSTEKGRSKVEHVWLNRIHTSSANSINDIAVAEKGRMWLLGDYELYLYDIKTRRVKAMNIMRKLRLSNTMRQLRLCGERIFIGTYNDGVLVYDIHKGTISRYIDVGCNVITCLFSDREKLYVGTDGAGLSVISLRDNRILTVYDNSPSSQYRLKDNTVYAFYHDPSGVNFFGYFRQGLDHSYYVKPFFNCYVLRSKKDGRVLFDTHGVNIRSIYIDGSVKVLGSRGGLYYVDEANERVKFFSPKELGGSIVVKVIKYSGQYYCCTFNGGVMRIDPHTLTTSRFGSSDALRTGSFGDMAVSPDNELWMSGNAGVFIYNALTDTERHFDSSNSPLPNVYCNNILFDRQGRCWISTAQGMYIYDPIDRRLHSGQRQSGASQQAGCFPIGFFNEQSETHGVLGDKDNLLFYSLDGLFRTDEDMTQFGQITALNALQNEYFSQVFFDRRHRRYWFATEQGMFSADSDFKGLRKYADEYGLDSRGFSSGALCIDSDDRLWTGTMSGLYYADLLHAEKYSIDGSRIVLEDVRKGGVAADGAMMMSLADQNVVELQYNWGSDELSFMPVLLNYCKQDGLCFEYRVLASSDKGSIAADEGWTLIKNGERAVLDGLSLGQNVLQVRLAGHQRCEDFVVYVWPSWWFIAQCVLIIFVLIFSVVMLLQRRKLRMQHEEMVRVQRELDETKKKYSRVQTSDVEHERLYKRLLEYMRTDKPYLNNDLKLSDIASHLEVSTVKLSQLLNVYLEKNYYDFINQCRLEEFKTRLSMPQYKNYTLLALAEECGFKRSSFFSTFKNVEGVTPTEYVKRMKDGKK